jgi:hypothetical protein
MRRHQTNLAAPTTGSYPAKAVASGWWARHNMLNMLELFNAWVCIPTTLPAAANSPRREPVGPSLRFGLVRTSDPRVVGWLRGKQVRSRTNFFPTSERSSIAVAKPDYFRRKLQTLPRT